MGLRAQYCLGMVVRFTKARHEDRPHTFTCIRDDGSTTGMPSSGFFVRHDLTHYAVETVLGLGEAFYGLLSQGWEISSFEERQPGSRKARAVPPGAMLAECLAGLLDLDLVASPTPAEELIELLRDRLGADTRLPSPEEIGEIRCRRAELMERWSALAPGETLELTFPA